MDLCKYSEYLGLPNQGIHSYRLFDVAIIDVIFTVIAAYFLARLFDRSFILCLVVLFIIGIVFHRVFCVRTKIDRLLF